MSKIIIAGWIEIPEEKRAEALDLAKELFEPTRAQPGCVDYAWTADPHNLKRVYVYECWENPENLESHLKGPWYKKMFETMNSFGLTGVDISKFEISRQGGVYGPEGPTAVFFD